MAKPNRQSQEFWFDTFSDMPVADQAAAIRILEQVHRLAVRAGKNGTPKPDAPKDDQKALELREPGQ